MGDETKDEGRADRGAGEQHEPRDLDRRQFVKTAGIAGIAGAAGFRPTMESAGRIRRQQQAPEFPRPEGLQPGAQLDSRFPVSFQTCVSEGLRLVTEYFTALNRRDLERIADTLHFPFAIYENIEPVVRETREEFLANPPSTLNWTGSGLSRVKPGSYDMLEGIDIHLYCPVGGVFSLEFTRFGPDGHKLLDCEGVYSVTNNDGRWAIQLVSTIFHERGYEDLEYPGAAETHIEEYQGYLAEWGYRNEETLNNPQAGRGSYDTPLPPGTLTASVDFGYGPRARSRNARENHPMSGWRTEGITSRLEVEEADQPGPPGSIDTELDEFVDLAGGTVGDYGYTRLRPERPIVIHATHDKAHVLGGYWRYTYDGTLISETRSVDIRVYKEGSWSDSGDLGQVTHHDRSNSVG